MYKINLVFALLWSSLFFISCNSENKPSTSLADTLQNAGQIKPDTLAKNAKIFALPAPLQIPTIIKNNNAPFMENLLVPAKRGRVFSSDYSRALNLGIYTVDVGCAAVYNQKQSGLNYYQTIAQLLQDLNLTSKISVEQLKRFEKNINHTDSTSAIILESYNSWQNYFQENKREEIGLYIMSGSYIESLYLLLNSQKLISPNSFQSLLGQQKLFLDNLLELSNYMEKHPEFDDLYNKLGPLQEAFAPIEVIVKDGNNLNSSIYCKYNDTQINLLSKRTKEVRNELIR